MIAIRNDIIFLTSIVETVRQKNMDGKEVRVGTCIFVNDLGI